MAYHVAYPLDRQEGDMFDPQPKPLKTLKVVPTAAMSDVQI